MEVFRKKILLGTGVVIALATVGITIASFTGGDKSTENKNAEVQKALNANGKNKLEQVDTKARKGSEETKKQVSVVTGSVETVGNTIVVLDNGNQNFYTDENNIRHTDGVYGEKDEATRLAKLASIYIANGNVRVGGGYFTRGLKLADKSLQGLSLMRRSS